MAESVPLQYHGPAFRLLGREPRVSADAVRAIEECEAACGVRLPAALREYYTLDGAELALAESNKACGPNSLAGILKGFAAAVASPPAGEPPAICFFGPWRVNTGYESWVTLDGSDDPPVDAEGDSRKRPFSHYVADLAWWRSTLDDSPGILVGGPARNAGMSGS
jgi:hypothetical protein